MVVRWGDLENWDPAGNCISPLERDALLRGILVCGAPVLIRSFEEKAGIHYAAEACLCWSTMHGLP